MSYGPGWKLHRERQAARAAAAAPPGPSPLQQSLARIEATLARLGEAVGAAVTPPQLAEALQPVAEALAAIATEQARQGERVATACADAAELLRRVPPEPPGWAPWAPWPGERQPPPAGEPGPVVRAVGGAVALGAVAPIGSVVGPILAETPLPEPEPLPTGWALRRGLPGTAAVYWTGQTRRDADRKGRPILIPLFGTPAEARTWPDRAGAADAQRWNPELRGLFVVDLGAEETADA